MNFKANESAQKLRGGYYTPLEIARFLIAWAIGNNARTLLEPSCGDGAFLEALSILGKTTTIKEVTAIEVERSEAAKARLKASNLRRVKAVVHNTDFLSWAIRSLNDGQHYDAIVGNPPFIRYQYLNDVDQRHAQTIFKQFRLHFTKHTNAWVPFVLASIGLLRPGGRIAMVLPAEILHVTHAQSLRTFIGHNCIQTLIFDPEEILFEETLQGAILLLAEKKHQVSQQSRGIAIVQTTGRHFLRRDADEFFRHARYVNGQTVEGKWTRALLRDSEIQLFDELSQNPRIKRFGEIATVDVGIVTGANKYFLVNDHVVEAFGLRRWAHPMFGRSGHCPGVIYDRTQHQENRKNQLPTNFLWFTENQISRYEAGVRRYLREGERQQLHTRYKCRIRNPWFKVPSVYATEVGMLKRAHDIPRLILNTLGAYTTDTAYRIRTINGTNAANLVYTFVNPLTALSAEIEGRYYGGGVLELIPSEIERLLVPLTGPMRPALATLDKNFRDGMSAIDILSSQAAKILGPLGVSTANQDTLVGAWAKLRSRRQRLPADETAVETN